MRDLYFKQNIQSQTFHQNPKLLQGKENGKKEKKLIPDSNPELFSDQKSPKPQTLFKSNHSTTHQKTGKVEERTPNPSFQPRTSKTLKIFRCLSVPHYRKPSTSKTRCNIQIQHCIKNPENPTILNTPEINRQP